MIAALLAAATASVGVARADTGRPDGDLGAYLRARVAEDAGQGDDAVAGYAAALAHAPRNPVIAIRAWRAALAVGDVALARQAAAALTAAGLAPDDAALLPLADAARAGDPAAATRALAAIQAGRLRILVPALRAWIAATTGGDGLAVEAPQDDAISRRLLGETRALLLIADGRRAEGIAAIGAIGGPVPNGLHLAAAELLYGAGQDEAAATLLGRRNGQIAAARAGATGRPTLAFAVSRLLMRLADDLGGDQPSGLALALSRLSLQADPGYARARLSLAEQLALADDRDRALAELALVPADGPLGATAAGRRIALLDDADRTDDALAAARVRATSPDAVPVDRARYADLLVAADRPAESLLFYAAILKGDEGNGAAWFRYGIALDEAGRWPAARKALRRALALAPDQPTTLNYLGYAQVERGEDLAAATRLLERAHALGPDDASIADSLGWAYHRRGETVRALPLLERAAAGEPANAEIAEHLGDAYWTLGRRYEARYAWAAAAVTADPAATARLTTKSENGL
ncbi:tetratricopeptide repeat protein [Sphingomonas sp. CFBP 8760]|uniref:tetratricopeptide repeat protein n=1 Tax=Sphingomonas sp. CFBP 8760 TaxID=2775282 RepID=UPI003144D602